MVVADVLVGSGLTKKLNAVVKTVKNHTHKTMYVFSVTADSMTDSKTTFPCPIFFFFLMLLWLFAME